MFTPTKDSTFMDTTGDLDFYNLTSFYMIQYIVDESCNVLRLKFFWYSFLFTKVHTLQFNYVNYLWLM